tara:strand:- start:3348 stop:4208 length:861 start_codon:yes stop_codon:yes gene_type:complete
MFIKIKRIIDDFILRYNCKKFFIKPYDERVGEVKFLYAHKKNKERFKDYFDENFNILNNSQFFFDILFSFCVKLDLKKIHQIGCFTCEELRFLIEKKVNLEFSASDFDLERIDFLKKRFLKTKYKKINFKKIDLEKTSKLDFKGYDLICANSVFSNIQPENLSKLLSNLTDGSKILLIGDVYSKESLNTNERKSFNIPRQKNYFHPFISISRQLNLNYIFVPDFNNTSFTIARCVYIIYKKFDKKKIEKSLGFALKNYLARQNKIFQEYNEVNINKKWVKGKRWNT